MLETLKDFNSTLLKSLNKKLKEKICHASLFLKNQSLGKKFFLKPRKEKNLEKSLEIKSLLIFFLNNENLKRRINGP